jgi:peptide deformylase
MDIVVYPDPVLRRGGKEITSFDAPLRELAERMLEAMYAEGGVGLAAPQVGIEHRLLVLNPSGDRKDRSGELVMVNARITSRKGSEWGEEGCLSFPGIYAEVERYLKITVSYQDLDGKPQELMSEGWLARIIQHEMDHLTGVLFVDRLSAADKIRVRSKLEELEKRYRARVG